MKKMIFAMTIAAGMMTTTFAMAQKKATQKVEDKKMVKSEVAAHPQTDAAGNAVAPAKANKVKTAKATDLRQMKNEPTTATSKVKAKKAVKAKTIEEKTK